MHYYEVAPVKIVRATSASFTYCSDAELPVGSLVEIEVGKKTIAGIILRNVKKPSYNTKQIGAAIEETPLPRELITLAEWMSDYYATHLATVLQTVLPRGLQKARRALAAPAHVPQREKRDITFTPEQSAAIETIESSTPGSILLHGVTGSGKTAVYIKCAQRAIQRGESVIIIVPEIALTSQTIGEFSHHFSNIILTHSRQTEAQRHIAWKNALNTTEPSVVIGPRSALFLPLRRVGLIVIDEAHEPSLKQEQAPRYSALRAATMLAKFHKTRAVFGSATPLIADYYGATASQRPIIRMSTPAASSTKPTIALIDMTKRNNFLTHRFISDALNKKITETLAAGKQTLVFHNRRGSTSVTLCEECGWQAGCPRCFIPLTLHADSHQLRCHICGVHDRVPTSCPTCGSADIVHKGIGTKLIESELRKLYPKATIARFDGDVETGESVEEKYQQLYDGDIDIIIGTQVIAKGLDLPHLRTVGVVQADAGLSLPDYGSSERTFQLLAQVVGRVGRSHHETDVIIQSYQPTHPAVTLGVSQDYAGFYDVAINERKRAGFPPYTFLLKLTCVYKSETAAIRNAKTLANDLRKNVHESVSILGPTPAFYERQHDTYRWQLTLKSPKRQHLIEALQFVPPTHWQTELDPHSLL